MKGIVVIHLAVLSVVSSCLVMASENPFSKLGYKKQVMYTSSKGEFAEFHDQKNAVEIGSVYFNTKTNQIVGFINQEKEQNSVSPAITAMSVDPLCEKYYWISPYAYCLDNPVRLIDPDGRLVMSKEMQKDYPELTKYVKGLLNEWNNQSSEFRSEFMEKSSLNENQVKRMLTFGEGPTLEVVKNLKDDEGTPANGLSIFEKDGKTNALTNVNNGEGLLQIDLEPVNMLETAKSAEDKGAGRIMIGATTFHELTHIGNVAVNGTVNGKFTESGQAFEKAAYGKGVETYNAKDVWRSKQPDLQPLIAPLIPLLNVTR